MYLSGRHNNTQYAQVKQPSLLETSQKKLSRGSRGLFPTLLLDDALQQNTTTRKCNDHDIDNWGLRLKRQNSGHVVQRRRKALQL